MTGPKPGSAFASMLNAGVADAEPEARKAESKERQVRERPARQERRAPVTEPPEELAAEAPRAFQRVTRENLNVRVRPDLRRDLDMLVNRLQGQGWNIRHHHVLEHMLAKLRDPEYVARLCQELAEE